MLPPYKPHLETGPLVDRDQMGRKTYPAAMCINNKRKAVELPDSINARRANPGLSVLRIP